MFCTRYGLITLALFTSNAFAQGEDAPWMLSLSTSRDENAYEHRVGSFHIGLTEATWLSIAAGSSRAPSVEADVRARLIAASIEHDFGSFGVAFGAESWGDADNLETADLRGEIFFSGERYRLALSAEQREIDIYFSGDGAPRVTDLRRFGVDADGYGLNGRFRIAQDWQIYGTWMEYDYPQRMRVVPRADRLNLLSVSAVTLAYSFVDRYATFGVEKAFGQILLNVDVGHDRSAIDRSRLKSLRASVLVPVAARLDLELAVGSSRIEGGTATLYGGITLLVYGGG